MIYDIKKVFLLFTNQTTKRIKNYDLYFMYHQKKFKIKEKIVLNYILRVTLVKIINFM